MRPAAPMLAGMERITPHAVALSGLRKSYGDRPAVAGIDLLIAPGEVVALLGPNGAGKSTTVDLLLGLTPPTPATSPSSARTRAGRSRPASWAPCSRRSPCWRTPP